MTTEAGLFSFTLLFAIFIVALPSSSSLDAETIGHEPGGKSEGNINDLFDLAIPMFQKIILENKLDPMKLDNFSEILPGLIIKNRTITLKDGSLQGLSDLKRSKDAILSYANKILSLDVTVEFDVLDAKYDYLLKDKLMATKGNVYADAQDMDVHIIVGLDFHRYQAFLSVLTIDKIRKLDVRLEGNKSDPIFNIALKFLNRVVRKKITDVIEEKFTKFIQGYINDLNSNLPVPNKMQ